MHPQIRWRIAALLLLAVLVAVGAATSVQATTYHYPPWADNFHYEWASNDYTRDAANPARDRQAEISYFTTAWLNQGRDTLGYYMQNDAVWSVYSHGWPEGVKTFDSEPGGFHKDMVRSYDLSGLRLGVYYSCYGASGSDNITKATVDAGAGAALGFQNTVQIAGGYQGPAYVWSTYFWQRLKDGGNIENAALYARDMYTARYGAPQGTESFWIYGNRYSTITPAGYK